MLPKHIKKITEAKLKAYLIETPHPTLVAIGIGIAMSVAVALVLSIADNGGTFSIQQAFANPREDRDGVVVCSC